jgi:hypothetical protein
VTGEAGVLSTAILLFRDAIVNGKLEAEEIEVVHDNSFGTDQNGLKLGALVGTRSDGSPALYGLTWMRSEDRSSFGRVLRFWLEVVGEPPGVLLSGGDLHFAEAVGDVFGPVYEQTRHFICTWHLAQSCFKHLSPLFSASVQCGGKASVATKSKWHDMNRAFWRIAKKSDWQSIGTFAEEFEKLRSMVRTSGAISAAGDKALAWLGDPAEPDADPASLYAKRMRWAARWTHHLFSRGSDSSKRAEAMFSGVRTCRARARPRATMLLRPPN